MGYEDIFEPIEVVTHFKAGKIIPLRFLWNNRTYKVKTIHQQWSERLGTSLQIHFSIHTDDQNWVELIFDNADLTWQLARVYLEG